ncbi:DUF6733 family protein [Steroidobacter cummioxidans]|uniref:DUF6733 family protein n=1 Tax=Steroidobacter cummioxidans TaxID=1803913 RepID=UPI0015821342|nr:DUF6733 family protein [Steroidobacter cummioxidans]
MTKATGFLAGLVAISALGMSSAHAQDDDRLSIDVSINHDAFFGTNPFLGAAYSMDNGVDLTFYGIMWGTGTGSAWGQWTEFGVGVGFKALDGALYINPQLGFTSGSLLSSGAESDGIIGDGIVPNLTIGLDTDVWEGQLYFGWYKDLRDKAPTGGTTNEYVHYWINGGRKFNNYFSAGLHFEELFLSGGSNVSSMDGYRWIGPYIQVAKGNAGLRFSFGTDTTSDSSSFSHSDFYKLQFFFSL